MLSVMTQIGAVAALAMLVWVMWGYSMAFGPTGGNAVSSPASARRSSRASRPTTTAATFTAGVAIPEYVFICFQMTFAAITVALVLGSVVERMKFSAVMVFAVDLADDRLFPDRAHGVGGAAGCSSTWARSISPAAPSSTSTPASRRWSPA